jgi:uncharacterized protein
MDLIIYHNACPDGFCAAYVAQQRWPNAALLARDHGLEPPYDMVVGKDVLVVDFSWRTREQNEKMASLAKSFHILDHHKSAQETLAGLPFATFDMNRSGAGLAWDYLFGVDAHEKIGSINVPPRPRPWYVDYVEDRDLWRNNGQGTLPNSKAVNAYIMTQPFIFGAWDSMVRGVTAETAALYGAGALRQIEHYVREGVKQAQSGKLFFLDEQGYVHEYKVAVVNAMYLMISDLCGELADIGGVDVAIGWFERGDGIMQFSLRSHHGADVSKLAQAKNGGGHAAAAGFQLSVAEGRNLLDSILGRTTLDTDRVFQAPVK